MATTQLLVRMIMPRVLDAGKCLEEVNRQLCQQIFNGQFVTMQVLVLDRLRGRIEIATAGHPPPLVIASGAACHPLELEPELVLGVEKEATYPTSAFELPSGANIVLYTDGVIDALAPDGSRFRVAGLCECLNGRFGNAQAMVDRILHSIDAFRAQEELADDLTLVALHLQPVNGQSAAPETAGSAA